MRELPDNPLSALTLMPSTAAEVARFSKGIIEAVKEGRDNPIKILVMLRALEAVSEMVREEIDENIGREADNYSEKKFEAFGALVEKTDVYTKYNYDTSHDIEWEQLNSEFETIKRRKTERETFLKSLKEPLTLVNPDTGEVYNIRPPFKKSKAGVKVYIK
jgi:hypothetical protein